MQGDVIELLDEDGVTVAKYEYDAWGKILSIKDATGNTITDANHIGNRNPIRYRGYYYDKESRLYYLQSRYYDPEVGRFVNADGLISTGQGFIGFNMFVYCLNNPILFYDKSGNNAQPIEPEEIIEVVLTVLMGGKQQGGKLAAKSSFAYPVIGVTLAIFSLGLGFFSILANGKPYDNPAPAPAPAPSSQQPLPQQTPTPNNGSLALPAVKPEQDTKRSIIFPENPLDFNPIELKRISYPGTKNGMIIKWLKGPYEIFEWNEDLKHGPHYHYLFPGQTHNESGGIHYIAFEPVPEPWASLYFS